MSLSPLGLLNALVPKDRQSRRVAAGLAYGPHPRQRLDVYLPRRPAAGLPVLAFVHGGGWNGGDRSDYGFAGRAFAALGFLVLVPSYRIVPDDLFPHFVDDTASAAAWGVANAGRYAADGGRVFLAGHSAGAYNAVMAALDPARFGAPELAGRIEGVVGLSGPYDFYPFDVAASRAAFAGVAEPLRTQPVNLVTPAAPPMFLGHGDADTIVAPRNTRRLAEKLRENGVPVDARFYPGLGHEQVALSLMRPFRRRWPVLADVADWLGRRVNQTAR